MPYSQTIVRIPEGSPIGGFYEIDGRGIPLVPLDFMFTCAQGDLNRRGGVISDHNFDTYGHWPNWARPFGPAVAYREEALRNNMNPALVEVDTNHDGVVVSYLETHEGCKGVAAVIGKSTPEDDAQLCFLDATSKSVAQHVAETAGLPCVFLTGYAKNIGAETGVATLIAGPVAVAYPSRAVVVTDAATVATLNGSNGRSRQ